MVWTGDEFQTGLIKTKNCFTKISFTTKLDIYIYCSIIDIHAYPEREQ